MKQLFLLSLWLREDVLAPGHLWQGMEVVFESSYS